jgi:Leucine-rich repeat (LRR) protein
MRRQPGRRKIVLFALVLLAAPNDASATPWTVTFGNCSFSGDYAGAPLVRAGSCLSQSGSLNLRGRFITSLPANSFEGLAQMTGINLGQNQLSALPANLFVGLNSLNIIYLNGNQLRTLPVGVFSGLPMVAFDLTNNAMSTLPVGVFSGLGGLREFNLLAGNTLQCVPFSSENPLALPLHEGPATATCTSVPWTVTVGNCSFSGDYAGAAPLRAGSCPQASQAGVVYGVGLNLGSRTITSLPANVFDGMSSVKEIILFNNQLRVLPANLFVGLNSLTWLSLGGNQLSALTTGVFSGLGALRSLDLSGNALSTLPVGVLGLNSLTWLSLRGNQLSALTTGVFSGLGALRSLDLSGNALSTLPVGVFSSLSALRSLDLSGNTLSTLPVGAFSGLETLESLYLSENALSTLPVGVFSGLASLKELYLYGNALSTLPVGVFSGLESLSILHLQRNTMKCVPLSSEIRLALTVYYGPVTCTSVPWTVTFGNCSFSGDYTGAPLVRAGSCLSQSGSLNLRGRSITSLPANTFEGIAQMTAISLNKNQLSALPTNLFVGLNSLRTLDLGANQLSVLTTGVFSGLGALSDLDLSGNALSTLPVGVFSGLTREITRADYNASFHGKTLDSTGNPSYEWFGAYPWFSEWFVVLDKDGDQILSREEYQAGFDMFDIKDGKISLSDLKTLYLDGNQLTTLPENVFSGLIYLRDLWISRNRLSALPSGLFSGLLSFRSLALGDWGGYNGGCCDRCDTCDGSCCTVSGNQLQCVPLSAQKRAAIERYDGPETLCMPSTSVPEPRTVAGSTEAPTSTPAPLGSENTTTSKPTSTGLNTATLTSTPEPLLGILLAQFVVASFHLLV